MRSFCTFSPVDIHWVLHRRVRALFEHEGRQVCLLNVCKRVRWKSNRR